LLFRSFFFALATRVRIAVKPFLLFPSEDG